MGILFFDIDGTLLDKKHRLPVSAAEAIGLLREKGHLAFINTGFSLAEIRRDLLAVGFDGIVASNGTSIHTPEKTLLEKTISPQLLDTILPLFEKQKVDLWLSGPRYVYVADKDAGGFMGNVIRFMNQGRDIVRTWHDTPLEANKCTYHYESPDQIGSLLPVVNKDFAVVPHAGQVGELLIKGYNKATGIDFILKHLGMENEEVFAFGDSSNDLAMFERATHSIAMGDGNPSALEASDYVTAPPGNDGIYLALKHYRLI